MQKTKTQKGITLVALIITIIVLLILAVVAIQAITGDGIIQHAKNATTQTELAQEREELQLEVLNWRLVNDAVGTTLVEHFGGKYGAENVQENADGSITVTLENGNKYVITEDGIITYLDGTVEEPAPKPAPSITLSTTTITKEITHGTPETVTLTATLANATGALNWESSDEDVAKVTGTGETGTVTLKAAGTATITVSYGTTTATCSVTVTEKPISITLDITSIEKVIASGETETVTLTATLVNATGNLTWSTSNDEVAVVTGTGETGTVTLNAVTGTAVITVSYGDASATCTIKVTKKISFTIDGTTYYAEEGMTWEKWMETDYNTDKRVSLAGETLVYPGDNGLAVAIRYGSSSVTMTELIIMNAVYTLSNYSGGSN